MLANLIRSNYFESWRTAPDPLAHKASLHLSTHVVVLSAQPLQPLLKSLGLAGAIRVSLALYNDSDDLQRFFDALDQALELLQ